MNGQGKKLLQRHFINPANVEVEICLNSDGNYFVRHHTYWWIVYEKRNPDPIHECIIDNLKIMANNRLSTIKWAGHRFQFEMIGFDDGLEVEAVLLPLKMFEDFILFQSTNYKGTPSDNNCVRLGRCLKSRSIEDLLIL
jgi:hypothetical protein